VVTPSLVALAIISLRRPGHDISDLTLRRDGYDLMFAFENGDSVRIQSFFWPGNDYQNAITEVRFGAEETGIRVYLPAGVNSYNFSSFANVNGVLVEGAYIFRSGDGQGAIQDLGTGGKHKVLIFPDYAVSDVSLRSEGDDLLFSFVNGDSVRLQNLFLNTCDVVNDQQILDCRAASRLAKTRCGPCVIAVGC